MRGSSPPTQQRLIIGREFGTAPLSLASMRAMKFLHVTEQGEGGRYAASLRETAIPVPERGEVLIQVAASGVNRADLSQIAGRYPPPPGESEILGLEVAGRVEETGETVCALL